jgi:hypothetical protein
MGIQQATIRALSGEPAPPPPILGLELTSGLYPVVVSGDAVVLGASLQVAQTYTFFDVNVETVALAAALPSAPVLNTTVSYTTYSNWPVESSDLSASLQGSPVLTTTIQYTNYTNWPVESANLLAGLTGSIDLAVVIQYLNYTNWPVESVNLVANLQGVTLA